MKYQFNLGSTLLLLASCAGAQTIQQVTVTASKTAEREQTTTTKKQRSEYRREQQFDAAGNMTMLPTDEHYDAQVQRTASTMCRAPTTVSTARYR